MSLACRKAPPTHAHMRARPHDGRRIGCHNPGTSTGPARRSRRNTQLMSQPLAGIRVIELANFIAGPLAGTLLADMGADVVKVEPPQGDMGRATPPIRDGESVSFVALNRNKRSLVLDLKRPQAIEILLKLARVSDVVLEAYRPGALDKLGFGAAHV